MKSSLTALLFLAVAASPASAQDETFTASVRHNDLNLASPAGVETFRGRVKALANRVCGEVPVAPIREAASVAACRAQLFQSADAQAKLGAAPASAALATLR